MSPGRSILFVTHEDLERTPVAAAMLDGLIQGMGERGWRCVLFSADRHGVDRGVRGGVRHLSFQRRSRGVLSPGAVLSMLGAMPQLARAIKEADLVFVRSYPMMILAAPLARLAGVPVVFDTRGLFFHELFDSGKLGGRARLLPLLQCLERALIRLSDTVVSVTEHQAAYYRGLASGRVMRPRSAVVYNGAPEPREVEVHEDAVGFVGSLSGWHLPERTFRIMERVQRLRPDTPFHVVTRETEAAHRLAAETGVRNVRIYSKDYRREPDRFGVGLCLIEDTVSKTVCFPVKLAEYLGSGTPVLLSDNVRSCARLVRTGSLGRTVSLSDTDEHIAGIVVTMLDGDSRPLPRLPSALTERHRIAGVADLCDEALRDQ